MTRPEQLQELLHTNQYFKMICGAGNEDTEEVRRLTMIYTLAGAKGFDISATPGKVLSFWYHMYGALMNNLHLEINDGNGWSNLDSVLTPQQTSQTSPWFPYFRCHASETIAKSFAVHCQFEQNR